MALYLPGSRVPSLIPSSRARGLPPAVTLIRRSLTLATSDILAGQLSVIASGVHTRARSLRALDRAGASVVAGLDQPPAILHGREPGIPVPGHQLEPGPPACAHRGRPPPLVDRPGPGPGGDRQPWPAIRRQPGRRRGNHRPTSDGHRGPRVIGDPGRPRNRVDRGRSRSGEPPRPRT